MDDVLRELGELIHRHPTMTGREFLDACRIAAQGYFEADDLEPDLTEALLKALRRLPDAV